MYRGKLGHEPAAIKLLRTTQLSGSERERFLREAAILKSCRWVGDQLGAGQSVCYLSEQGAGHPGELQVGGRLTGCRAGCCRSKQLLQGAGHPGELQVGSAICLNPLHSGMRLAGRRYGVALGCTVGGCEMGWSWVGWHGMELGGWGKVGAAHGASLGSAEGCHPSLRHTHRRSQHLVAFRGVYIAPTEVAVVTELCLGGTPYSALSDGSVSWYNGCGGLEGFPFLSGTWFMFLSLASVHSWGPAGMRLGACSGSSAAACLRRRSHACPTCPAMPHLLSPCYALPAPPALPCPGSTLRNLSR